MAQSLAVTFNLVSNMISFRISLALAVLVFSNQMSIAGPKEDCALAIQNLGYTTKKYSFSAAGIFSRERHVFEDVIICYVTSEKKVHSI